MKKALTVILSLVIILLGVGITLYYIFAIKKSVRIYDDSADKYTIINSSDASYTGQEDDNDAEEEMITSSLTEEYITDDELPEEDESAEEAAIEYTYRYEGPWSSQIDVDIRSLMSAYPDVKGWIFFENEDISYPIVQGSSDDTYLRNSYDGQITVAGSIFMEAQNASDFSDPHTIIYGHNMRNNTMFGAFDNYLSQSNYYEFHKYFQIITTDISGNIIKNRYKIFSYGKTQASSKVYTVCHKNDDSLGEVIQYIQSGSARVTDIPVYQTDQVITLSTCSGKNKRLYVSAVKVDSFIQ